MNETVDSEAIGHAGSRAREGLAALLGEAAPGTVFSDPITVGDAIVITASAWERGGGFGFGGGGGANSKESGSGAGGGGGGSQGRPVAVIKIGPGGVEVRPVIDFTKIGVTLVLAAVGLWRALRR